MRPIVQMLEEQIQLSKDNGRPYHIVGLTIEEWEYLLKNLRRYEALAAEVLAFADAADMTLCRGQGKHPHECARVCMKQYEALAKNTRPLP